MSTVQGVVFVAVLWLASSVLVGVVVGRMIAGPRRLEVGEAVSAAEGKPSVGTAPSAAGVTHTAPTLEAVRQVPSPRRSPGGCPPNVNRPRALPRGRR